MTPLQRIAMGLVIVLVDAYFGAYDGVPDPIGWTMVITGVVPLRAVLGTGGALLGLAVASLATSVVTYVPAVADALDESGGWALSLPQLAFSFALCTVLATASPELAQRLRVLRWVFAGLAAGPVLVFGGGLEALREPLAFVVVAANVYVVYLLFRASGQLQPDDAATDEGRLP